MSQRFRDLLFFILLHSTMYFVYFHLFLSRWAKSYVFFLTLVMDLVYVLQDAPIRFFSHSQHSMYVYSQLACQKKRLVRSTVNELLRGHKWPCQHQVLTLKFNFNEYVRSAQPLNGIHWCNLWAERAYCLQCLCSHTPHYQN